MIIEDICKRFSAGKSIKAENINETGLYPVYGGNGLRGYTDTYNFEGECAIIGRQGAYCGNVRYFSGQAYMTEHAIVAEPKDDYDACYLANKLSLMNLSQYQGQSAQPGLSAKTLSQVKIEMPDEKEQRTIGKFLHTIDKKIELNKNVNDNLQRQLKLMYDYWFTQFDFPDENGRPYRSSGGKMVWNDELQREIPVGWKCCTLGDLLTKNSISFDYQSIEPTIDLSVMPTSSIALDKLNTSDIFSTNLFVMKEGDIMFGSIRPYLKKAGIAPCNGVFAGTIHSYSVKKDIDYNFALFTLCRDAFFDYAVQVSSGTKMPVISNENLLAYKTAYSSKIAEQFNAIDAKDIICKNVQETQQLTALRDWLLPMLMSGQATIAE